MIIPLIPRFYEVSFFTCLFNNLAGINSTNAEAITAQIALAVLETTESMSLLTHSSIVAYAVGISPLVYIQSIEI